MELTTYRRGQASQVVGLGCIGRLQYVVLLWTRILKTNGLLCLKLQIEKKTPAADLKSGSQSGSQSGALKSRGGFAAVACCFQYWGDRGCYRATAVNMIEIDVGGPRSLTNRIRMNRMTVWPKPQKWTIWLQRMIGIFDQVLAVFDRSSGDPGCCLAQRTFPTGSSSF